MTSLPIYPEWLSEEGIHTLSNGYLLPGETPRDLFQRVSKATVKYLPEYPEIEEEVFECLWNGWIGLATPVASNFGTNRGLPVSCYSAHLSDNLASIYSHKKEVAMLSKNGGGVGIYFGDIRPSGSPISDGGHSIGVVPWAQEYDMTARNVSQGGVRRGSFAMYLPIDHPDLLELLRSKDHSKGDPRKFIDSNIAVVITDNWLKSMIEGDKEKQELFGEVLKIRLISGSPYLLFIDNVNNWNPSCYKNRGLKVSTSNICTEITLYTDENHTFVCVLSSLNLAKYDEWKDWRSPKSGRSVPEIGIFLLEAVVSEFIKKAEQKTGLGRALRFAKKSRALGLGSMGLHILYQKRGYPFESQEARKLNIEVHKLIDEQTLKASQELAKTYGEPEWCEGEGVRHTHRTAIAPTRTNSVISGAFSQGIEPIDRNYFVAKQAKGSYVRKNPVLDKLFKERGIDEDVWYSILSNNGSVQHLDCLTEHEKKVFKTAREIDQFELVKQAADRQPYICQAQSLNLFVDPLADAEYLFRLHLSAWKMGVKSLYYLKSSSLLTRKTVENILITKDGCPWCVKLKEQLRIDGISYTEITKDEAVERGLWNEEWKTVPKLKLNNNWILGYDDYVSKFHNVEIEYHECVACEG